MLLMKYESIKLVIFKIEESMEESKKPKNRWRNRRNLMITDDEEEKRPAMKQEH